MRYNININMTFGFLKKTIILLASTLLLLSSSFIGANAQASNRPSPLTLEEQNIAVNLTQPFTVYFQYGSNVSNINISNAIASATIVNSIDTSVKPSFEFVADDTYKNYDIFEGDPSRSATEQAPRSAFPCNTFDGPKYEIPSSFFTSSEMKNYGLQTAKTTPQQTAILTKGSSGCIALQVKVSSNAKIGDKAFIQFDSDAGLSPDFEASLRPNLLIQPLAIVAGQSASSVSSSSVSKISVASVIPSSSSSSSSVVAVAPRTGGNSTGVFFVSSFIVLISSVLYITKKKTPSES